MSITKEQAGEMLQQARTSGAHKMMASNSDELDKQSQVLQTCCNELEKNSAALPFPLFTKIFQIIAIVTGPGTWQEKVTQIFNLFNQPVPAGIQLP